MWRKREGSTAFSERESLRRPKFGALLYSDHQNTISSNYYQDRDSEEPRRNSIASVPGPYFDRNSSPSSGNSSPYVMYSPLNTQAVSPYVKSPWTRVSSSPTNQLISGDDYMDGKQHLLIGSLLREEGHIYSLAVSGDLLYTGSDSRNIRVWKNLREYSVFKSSSGLVKAIVLWRDKVFTGHQDGKIRVWKQSSNRKAYKQVSSLPTNTDFLKSAINPKNYVEVRRNRNVPWIRHFDAVSCLSLDEDQGLLYSGSWDKTLKVWRLSDYKCLESIAAHDDAINSVAVGFDGLVFTGSADGTVKVWRRELVGKSTSHVLVITLLRQDYAVTALAVDDLAGVVYSGSSDGMVNFWEREKHFLTHGGALRGHKLAVLCLAAAGNLVVSGSADKTICVWRREEGGLHTCLSVLMGQGGPVKCLALKEDPNKGESPGRWIVYSGSLDRSVKVWRLWEHVPELGEFDEP